MRTTKQRLNVVVVGSRPRTIATIRTALASLGIALEHFDSAETFLGEAGRWDALICLAELPGMCGYELQCRLTRAGNCQPIFLVASHHSSRRRDAWPCGRYTRIVVGALDDSMWASLLSGEPSHSPLREATRRDLPSTAGLAAATASV